MRVRINMLDVLLWNIVSQNLCSINTEIRNISSLSGWFWAPKILPFKWVTMMLLWCSGMHWLHARAPKKRNQIQFKSIHPLTLNRIFVFVFHLSSVSSQYLIAFKGPTVDERTASSFPSSGWMFINDTSKRMNNFALLGLAGCLNMTLSLHQLPPSILNYTIFYANWYADESRVPILEKAVFWFDSIGKQP